MSDKHRPIKQLGYSINNHNTVNRTIFRAIFRKLRGGVGRKIDRKIKYDYG